MTITRRRALSALAAGVVGSAGCLGEVSEAVPNRDTTETDGDCGTTVDGEVIEDPDLVDAHDGIPVAEPPLYLPYETEHLREEAVSGGVGQDGIPSIDSPKFAAASEAELASGDPIFGVVRNGHARAYPQCILVWHEIVNDVIAGDPIAVTYCPLTGTAQGFERGDTTFGVSGSLVSSNLIMYDRGSDSWWPQIFSSGIDGPHEGDSLREFRVIWTTWGRWVQAHPDTVVLTDDTGFARRYGVDPYGEYNPLDGYYAEGGAMFTPLDWDEQARAAEKAVVLGGRTDAGAIAFKKDSLLDERVLTGSIGDRPVVAVSDPRLETGYLYTNPNEVPVDADGVGYDVEGETYPPDELPLEGILCFDAMWFAWFGCYPTTEYVE